jgi:hypothetical protein
MSEDNGNVVGKKVDGLTLRIILLIVVLIVFFRTGSVKRVRELRKLINDFLGEVSQQNESVVRENESVVKDNEGSVGLGLDEKTREYIIRAVVTRNYRNAKRRLEKMNYTNVRIQKIRELIIITTDQGKEVLTIRKNSSEIVAPATKG